MTPGIRLIHKPQGPTSFKLVRSRFRDSPAPPGRRPRRICHGGTLDPFASGLLLILIEPATQLFDYLHAIPKVYDATVQWGTETDTGDLLGNVVSTGDPSNLNAQMLDDALATFTGWREQMPHPTSAKRIDGERAYLKVHRGETVEMPASKVYLHEAHWIAHNLPLESQLQITVRGGYYVRALARDLGQLLSCGAHLTQLHRASIGPWVDPGPAEWVDLHGRDILPWAPTKILTERDIADLKQGKTISAENVLPPDWQLPPEFPDPQPPVRGFHNEKLRFLLKPTEGQLGLLTQLGGGL
ncbi:MAG: tRNA pseudouridine(55) synthase TruB [Planctomycetota bacterium]|nr:tRNA pseudouridine(55) synthase TruB [Planctomycetota bacterium]